MFQFGGNGDGTLVYPGRPDVIGGKTDIPIASIRLKMIRECSEIYEYLKIVSDLGDPTFALQTAKKLFQNANPSIMDGWTYSSNKPPEAIYSAREALANQILKLKGTGTGLPQNTALPAVSGSTVQGQVLSSSNGSWTNNPTSFAYQWSRCDASGANCTAIQGATANTYTLAAADVRSTMRSSVTATNSAGSGSAVSAATPIVSATSQPSVCTLNVALSYSGSLLTLNFTLGSLTPQT